VKNASQTLIPSVDSLAQVKGYPTLKVLVNGAEFKTFKGPRDLDGLSNFLKDATKDALGETVA
jgi:hypothetical protein